MRCEYYEVYDTRSSDIDMYRHSESNRRENHMEKTTGDERLGTSVDVIIESRHAVTQAVTTISIEV